MMNRLIPQDRITLATWLDAVVRQGMDQRVAAFIAGDPATRGLALAAARIARELDQVDNLLTDRDRKTLRAGLDALIHRLATTARKRMNRRRRETEN